MVELSRINVQRTVYRSLSFKGSATSLSTETKPAEPVTTKVPLGTQKGYALASHIRVEHRDPANVNPQMPIILDYINKPVPKDIAVSIYKKSNDIDTYIHNKSENNRKMILIEYDGVGITDEKGNTAFYNMASEKQLKELNSSIANLPFIQGVQQLGIDKKFDPSELLATLAEKTLKNEGIEWKATDSGIKTEYKGYNINLSNFDGYTLTIEDPKTEDCLTISPPHMDEKITRLGDTINQASMKNNQ